MTLIKTVTSADVTKSLVRSIVRGSGAAPPSYTYATWNELDKSASFTLSNGDLSVTQTAGNGAWHLLRSTISQSSGEWQGELTNSDPGGDWIVGIC